MKVANNVKGAFGTYLAYQEVQSAIYFLSSRSKPTIRNQKVSLLSLIIGIDREDTTLHGSITTPDQTR